MLNILSILNYIKKCVEDLHERVYVMDDEHIKDTKTGLEFHLYDDYFKATYDDKLVLKMSDLSEQEQMVVWEIKQLITDPDKVKERKEEYPKMMKKHRMEFSELFENPNPVASRGPEMEEDTQEYMG